MKLENQKALEPKSRKAALNQAVQCQLQIERNSQRKENTMKHQTEVQKKIEALNEELERLEKTIQNLDVDSESYQARLSELQTRFELTELDISEAKLASLRRNIERQQALMKAGLKPDIPTLI